MSRDVFSVLLSSLLFLELFLSCCLKATLCTQPLSSMKSAALVTPFTTSSILVSALYFFFYLVLNSSINVCSKPTSLEVFYSLHSQAEYWKAMLSRASSRTCRLHCYSTLRAITWRLQLELHVLQGEVLTMSTIKTIDNQPIGIEEGYDFVRNRWACVGSIIK